MKKKVTELNNKITYSNSNNYCLFILKKRIYQRCVLLVLTSCPMIRIRMRRLKLLESVANFKMQFEMMQI